MEPEADCKTRGVFRGLRCGGGGGGDRKGGPIRLEGNGLREKEREKLLLQTCDCLAIVSLSRGSFCALISLGP